MKTITRIAMIAATALAPANAATIATYSFETPALIDGGFTDNVITGWSVTRQTGSFAYGTQNPQDAQFTNTTGTPPAGTLPGSANGLQMAYSNVADQLLFPTVAPATVAAAGEVWTTRVAIGYRSDQEPSRLFVGLAVGTATFGTNGNEPEFLRTFELVAKGSLVQGSFVDMVSTYTTVAGDIGKEIRPFTYNGGDGDGYTGTF